MNYFTKVTGVPVHAVVVSKNLAPFQGAYKEEGYGVFDPDWPWNTLKEINKEENLYV